ncbi:MAG TPA: hypothetical protein VMT50_11880 [Steroidobacteraceae bacterium]|nr:hypothetical protein [Steroidobacteraceae bacterium]
MARTLTSANAAITLNVPDVFAVPQPIEGFATDDAFDTDNVSPVEAVIGVDGKKSSGYTPYLVKQKITLQADSPSNDVFDQWRQANDASLEDLQGTMTIVLPGLGKIYTFTKVSLTGAIPLPPGKKILQPQHYELTAQAPTAAPV